MDQPNQHVSEEVKELVIARLEVLPKDTGISIGSTGEFTPDQLIERVKEGDEIGQKIIEVQLNYLKSLKNLTQEFLDEQ